MLIVKETAEWFGRDFRILQLRFVSRFALRFLKSEPILKSVYRFLVDFKIGIPILKSVPILDVDPDFKIGNRNVCSYIPRGQ